MDERAFDDLLELYRWRYGIEDPSLLDWTPSMQVSPRITDAPTRDARPNAPARNTVVFGPSADNLAHPDRSVHIVVLDERASPLRRAEAGRVARDAIVTLARDGSATARWLRDPVTTGPRVTVLVHTADPPHELDRCLRSIFETTPITEAIEIVVADASTGDDAASVVAAWSARLAVRHVRADPGAGPLGACNLAADDARGEHLVLVGDRVRAMPGWLRPLVRALRDDPEVGVVGGKVLATGGALDAAGGVIFADGSVVGFGRGASDPNAPLFGFVRDVPYVSSDLLATRAGLFRSLGGVDRLACGGYEDVDLCMRVRAARRRVVFQPQSVVTAGAGASESTTETRARFVRRWAASLATLPARPDAFDAATWNRLARVA